MFESFKKKVNETLHHDVYKIVENSLVLEERAGGDFTKNYFVDCRISKYNKLIVFRPDEVKKKAQYIKMNPPKDCDYIVVDLEKEIIFIIELKKSSDTSTPAEVRLQLLAGKKWFEHILFVLGFNTNLNDYLCIPIHCAVDARQDRRTDMKPNNNVFKRNGNKLDLLEFTLKCGNRINKVDKITFSEFI